MSKTIISGHAALLLVLAGSIAAQAQEGDAEMPGLLDQTVPVADEPLEPETRTDEPSQEVLLAEFARFKNYLQMHLFAAKGFEFGDLIVHAREVASRTCTSPTDRSRPRSRWGISTVRATPSSTSWS